MNILPVLKKYKQRTLAITRQQPNKQLARRIRETAFRRTHQLRGFPGIVTSLCVAIDNNQLLINCRILDPNRITEKVGLKFENGSIQWIDDLLVYYRTSPTSLSKTLLAAGQPDRFTALITCEQSPLKVVSLVLNLKNGRQRRVSLKLETSPSTPITLIARLLELVPRDANEKRRVFDAALGTMIGQLWAARATNAVTNTLICHNESLATDDPEVSIIIPIYGRYDFIEYQLAVFANDDFMHQQEIIYVIDDPRLRDEVTASCEVLSRIYKIPFKLLLLQNNLGYAGANNTGVANANAKNILLLNSDVFPESAGWLDDLLSSLGHDVSNTILGARLKYHDESIQHDGMSFFSSPFAGDLWINMHPGKGLPADQFSCAKQPQSRECITGACLLISKDNYQALGGFDESYILGDFEDSDLCMKARAKGLAIALAENISLYHLERQSQTLVSAKRWKNELTYYNCWYHTRKWDCDINRLKQETTRAHIR